jgi:radical S-adenosyl methionine domain-containing protein 2
MCYEYNIKFKLNTVVCKYNYNEDMNEFIARLEPFRWKCFQVLIVKTENDGNDTIKNANKFTITDEEYEIFVRNHENQPSFIKEPNSIMKSSYLIIDEYMRFLDKGDKDQYIISESILDVDVFEALSQINWDTDSFIVIR